MLKKYSKGRKKKKGVRRKDGKSGGRERKKKELKHR